jgi:hypothetical protein
MKPGCPSSIDLNICRTSLNRIHDEDLFVNRVEHPIRNHNNRLVYENRPVEVTEDKEPVEGESMVPEWPGNPRIEIVVIPRRWVIGHHWRTFRVIIIIDHG